MKSHRTFPDVLNYYRLVLFKAWDMIKIYFLNYVNCFFWSD